MYRLRCVSARQPEFFHEGADRTVYIPVRGRSTITGKTLQILSPINLGSVVDFVKSAMEEGVADDSAIPPLKQWRERREILVDDAATTETEGEETSQSSGPETEGEETSQSSEPETEGEETTQSSSHMREGEETLSTIRPDTVSAALLMECAEETSVLVQELHDLRLKAYGGLGLILAGSILLNVVLLVSLGRLWRAFMLAARRDEPPGIEMDVWAHWQGGND